MEPKLTFNGLDGSDGSYLLAPMSLRGLFTRIVDGGFRFDDRTRRLRFGDDACDLASAGWGVVFAPDVTDEVREALQPLVDHRREKAASDAEQRFRVVDLGRGEDSRALSARFRAGPGPVDPDRLPYYLLLVGSPASLSFEPQYQLGIARAVGRLDLDGAEAYARYAASVIAAECGPKRSSPRATLFGVDQDAATRGSARYLVAPLATSLQQRHPDWAIRLRLADEARRSDVLAELTGASRPDFLFTAGHGVAFPADDRRQARLQGALLCQDWPGPGYPLVREHYLAAEDVADDARTAGLISFHFACFGAGTPRLDGFVHRTVGSAEVLAAQPMVSPLAKRLLGHPRGGSLAFVGHVDRAWGYSFLCGGEEQPETFASAISAILSGCPVGEAMKVFSDRYGELAAWLVEALHDERNGRPVPAKDLVSRWTATRDAASYTILGDPAVRLRVES